MESSVKYLSQCASFFQIFGHQYFSVASLRPESQNKYPSLGYTIYFLVVFASLSTQLIFIAFISTKNEDTPEAALSAKTIFTFMVQHSMNIGLLAILFVSLIQNYATTPLIKKLYLNCIKISKISEQDFNHLIDHRRTRAFVFKAFILIICLYSMTESTFYLLETYLGGERVWETTLLAILPLIFLHTVSFKFIFFVELVNFHLNAISKLIPGIFDFQPTTINHSNVLVKPMKFRDNHSLVIKIRNIRKIYGIVFENVEIINLAMGKTILTVVVVMVIVITSTCYSLFLLIIGKIPVVHIGGNWEFITEAICFIQLLEFQESSMLLRFASGSWLLSCRNVIKLNHL